MLDRTDAGTLKAAITANGQEPALEGDLSASPARVHEIVLNLRAVGDPDQITRIVEGVLPEGATMRSVQSFRPAPPQPERRG
jgi:hypothetical protein